jgi:DNA-binding MarR family transcriptional regulator
MHELLRTSGTTTFRITRLERRGLVQRLPDPEDHRGVIVALTEVGLELVDRVAPAHLANEERLLAALSPAEREELGALLRRVLLSFERSSTSGE